MSVHYPFSVDSMIHIFIKTRKWFAVGLLALAGLSITTILAYLCIEAYVSFDYNSKSPQGKFPSLNKNDVALVTGGSRGLGLAMVKLLSQKYELSRVFILDVVCPKQSLSERVQYVNCNLASVEEVEYALKTVFDECEKIGRSVSVLVNNAGTRLDGPVLSMSRASIQRVFTINTFAPVSILQSVVSRHIEQTPSKRLSIVTVSSVLGAFGACNMSAYSASKAAATQFHEVLTQELKNLDSIRTLLVTPGQLDTEMFRDVKQHQPFLIPLVDHFALARAILEKVDAGEIGIMCEPFYANFGYFIKVLPWSLQIWLRNVCKMDETIQSS